MPKPPSASQLGFAKQHLNPKLIAVSMAQTSNLKTINHPRFPWKAVRAEIILWSLVIISLPSFGFLLLRIATRMNLP